jgi:hypothetical protein
MIVSVFDRARIAHSKNSRGETQIVYEFKGELQPSVVLSSAAAASDACSLEAACLCPWTASAMLG